MTNFRMWLFTIFILWVLFLLSIFGLGISEDLGPVLGLNAIIVTVAISLGYILGWIPLPDRKELSRKLDENNERN